MKKPTKLILAVTLALGMAAGGSAYAFRGGDGGCGPMQGMRSGAPEEMVARHLDRLHADLKLSPDQEAQWKAWPDDVRSRAAAMKNKRLDMAKLSTLPAPERMEKMLEQHKQRQQQMEAALPALRAFYAKLTPEQQKVFDRAGPMGRMGDARGRGGPGNRGEQGGRRPLPPPEAGPQN